MIFVNGYGAWTPQDADGETELDAEGDRGSASAAQRDRKPFYWGVVQNTARFDGKDVLTVAMQRPLPKMPRDKVSVAPSR